MLFVYLKADYLKTKRLFFRSAHILIPLATAIIFAVYYSYDPWDSLKKISVYFQVLGMGLPFLIGLFCAMLSEQEQAAGACQAMLMSVQKRLPFISKLLILLLFGLSSLMIASALFGVVFKVVRNNISVGAGFYLLVPLVMFGSSIPMYILHLYLSLEFSKGVSIGLGIIESLVSALFLTGLGAAIWKYVPASWPARMSAALLAAYEGNAAAGADLYKMLPTALAVTMTALLLYIIWGGRWEGTRYTD